MKTFKQFLNEANDQKDKAYIIKMAYEGKPVPVDKGDLLYYCLSLTPKNFPSAPEDFWKQLEREGKDGWFVDFFCKPNIKPKDRFQYLPVYGSSNTYVTKWFYPSIEKCVSATVREGGIGLIRRVNEADIGLVEPGLETYDESTEGKRAHITFRKDLTDEEKKEIRKMLHGRSDISLKELLRDGLQPYYNDLEFLKKRWGKYAEKIEG